MKKRETLAAMLAITALIAFSCKKEEKEVKELFIYSGMTSIEAPFAGQNATLTFRTNCRWEIVDIPEWITVTQKSESGEGGLKNYSIGTTIAPNTEENSRKASLKINYGKKGLSKTISIRQASKNSMKSCTVDRITDDMLFSTTPAGTSSSVQQGFEFNEAMTMMYFSQVTSGYKNTISWTPRQVTGSTSLAASKMELYYYSHGNNIHYEKDGADEYIWLANWGTRDSEGKYTSPQVLSKVKLKNGAVLRPSDATESYYFGTKTLHASFDTENDQLAIFSQSDNYTMKIYKLSEVLATPVTDVTLLYDLTNGGEANGKKSPDAEYTGKPTIKAHDCRSLKPIGQFTYNYTSVRGWQTFCLANNKIYFFLFYKQTNPAPNGMYYQSVIDVFDLQGQKLRSDIKQPFSDNMEDLVKYGFTDADTKYMENEGILIRKGVLYLLYTAKNKAGFRRPVIFQFDASCVD